MREKNSLDDILKSYNEKRSRYKLYHTDEEWEDSLKRWKREEREKKLKNIFGEKRK